MVETAVAAEQQVEQQIVALTDEDNRLRRAAAQAGPADRVRILQRMAAIREERVRLYPHTNFPPNLIRNRQETDRQHIVAARLMARIETARATALAAGTVLPEPDDILTRQSWDDLDALGALAAVYEHAAR